MTAKGRALFACAALLLAHLLPREALASPMRVVLRRPSPPDPAVAAALTRIEGELVADGFEVVAVDVPQVVDASSAPAHAESLEEQGAAASIGIVVHADARFAELTVVDDLTHKAVVRRTPIDDPTGPKAAMTLAVRAVELLRASLLELLIDSHARDAARSTIDESAKSQASRWAERALAAGQDTAWAFDVGATVKLQPEGQVGPALAALVRVRRAFAHVFAVRVSAAGLGTEPKVVGPGGSATFGQALGLLELMVIPWSTGLLQPTFSVGVGALSTTVTGQASFPFVAHENTLISFAADAGLGGMIRISRGFAVSFEAHALLAQPEMKVQILGVEQARVDAPSFLASVTLTSFL